MNLKHSTSAFVLDVIDLVGQPGKQKKIQREVEAPENLGNQALYLPKGSPVTLDLSLESVVDGIYVSGTVSGQAVGECSRCVDPVTADVHLDVNELYLFPSKITAQDKAEGVAQVSDDAIDVQGLVHDTLAIELPIRPLCSEDCQGLCATCGIRMEEDPEHEHEVIDDRWAALKGLLDK